MTITMPETTDTLHEPRTDDLEFLRRAGIAADTEPRPSRFRLAALVLALLLAGATGLAAAAFTGGSVAGGAAGFAACATQCPMTAPSTPPGK